MHTDTWHSSEIVLNRTVLGCVFLHTCLCLVGMMLNIFCKFFHSFLLKTAIHAFKQIQMNCNNKNSLYLKCSIVVLLLMPSTILEYRKYKGVNVLVFYCLLHPKNN